MNQLSALAAALAAQNAVISCTSPPSPSSVLVRALACSNLRSKSIDYPTAPASREPNSWSTFMRMHIAGKRTTST